MKKKKNQENMKMEIICMIKKSNNKLKSRMKRAILLKEQLQKTSKVITLKSHQKKRKSLANSLLKYKISMVSLII